MLLELTPSGWIVVPILVVVGFLMTVAFTAAFFGTDTARIMAGIMIAGLGGYAVAAAGGYIWEYTSPHILLDILLVIVGVPLMVIGAAITLAVWSWLPPLYEWVTDQICDVPWDHPRNDWRICR